MKKRDFFYGLIGMVLLSGFIFSGCENFLNGENIKEQIKKDIYIANNECPVANVEEPAFSDSGVARNKAIVISFTKAIKPETFASSYTIADSQGNNLKDNFMAPEWSNENKLVTIPANEQNYIDLRGKRTLDIYFTLSNSCETPDGLPISSAINHKYRINDSVDNTAPTLNENTYAERAPIYFNGNLISAASVLYKGALDSGNEWMVCNINHINSKMNVYIEGKDYGGGSVKGHVVCRRVAEVTGTPVNGAASSFVFDLARQEDSENSSGSYTVDLSSSDYQDGLYEVKLYVQDTSNLDSEEYQTYYVIRDTSLAYCVTSRMVNDTSLFRGADEISPPDLENDAHGDQTYYDWLVRKRTFDIQTPTLRKIEDFRTRVLFDRINDDVYYTSALTNNTYAENDLTYFVSWGLDKEHMSSPVRIEGNYYQYDYSKASNGAVKYYDLPAAFISFLNENENSNIILKAIVLDCVGNQNVIYSLWPKTIDYYNYSIDADADGINKKAELRFSHLPVNDSFEDKKIHGKWRIFYAPLGSHDENEDLSDLVLKRNGDTYVENSDGSDKVIITGLAQSSKYVVYVQTAFDADSIYNGEYNCTTFGPLKKIIVDTDRSGGENLEIPDFTVTKIGGDLNSGLYKLQIDITDHYHSNYKYIPYYWDVLKLGYWGNSGWVDPVIGWLKLEAHTGEQSFEITVNNQLRAPLDTGESWVSQEWDQNINGGDNTYYTGVERCTNSKTYTPITGKIKLIAANDTDTTFSDTYTQDIKTFNFNRDDDTIPPKLSSKIVMHDSHLSYDGHCFEFNDLIREEEGNLTEYFTYYYTPYNSAWADNLNVLSEDQIKMLPSGRAPYTGTTWLEGEGEENDYTHKKACYRLDTSIPVYGLPDGDYMYFARLDDRYGNYTYATLGKAHIGTFKNKLKVELDADGKYFKSTLELEPDESFFNRNMINVQIFGGTWGNYYDWLNDLQNCKKVTINGKQCLYSHISDSDDPNIFVYKVGNGSTATYQTYRVPRKLNRNDAGTVISVSDQQRVLDPGNWYRITMQSFNENSITAEGGNGVNMRYGRPYTTVHDCTESDGLQNVTGERKENYNKLWNQDYLFYVDGEEKYDVCTEETVSNTVYYYTPWEGYDQNTHRYEKEEFSDYYASFFSGTATPRSNHSLLVNVFASSCNLGDDPDEWERRGKLVATHRYNGENCDFNQSVAADDVSKAREKGLVYYAAVVHFAKGESAVSDVYTMYGF